MGCGRPWVRRLHLRERGLTLREVHVDGVGLLDHGDAVRRDVHFNG